MKLFIFRAQWGMTGRLEEDIAQVAADGYDGIETSVQPDGFSASALRKLLDQYKLQLILGVSINTIDRLEAVLASQVDYQPLRIGVHAGQDSMSHAEGSAFFEQALKVAQKIGIPVGFETHRSRLFYTPWDTLYYLQQFPELRVVADFSHWVNVCERLPDDQRLALQTACERTIHIHGRVGYEEGPQVPDPSAPEYAPQLAWHEAQWAAVGQAHQRRAESMLTFTPEYGPPSYLHTLPHTNVPVADLSAICRWGASRARQQLGGL